MLMIKRCYLCYLPVNYSSNLYCGRDTLQGISLQEEFTPQKSHLSLENVNPRSKQKTNSAVQHGLIKYDSVCK